MPRYLFTNDLRISELPSAISSAIQKLKDDELWDDKSKGNNTATLQFYFNLHKGTDIVNRSESNPIIAIRNFVLKFQFPNTRTKESFDNCIEDNTLLAPYRVVVALLIHMRKLHPEIECRFSLWEIMYFVFASKVSNTLDIDYQYLVQQILLSRKNGINLESECSSLIEWNQSERQLREMLKILCYASKCFKFDKGVISFNENECDSEDKKFIEQILEYNKIWYPSDKNNFELAQQEYIYYMDTADSKYSIIEVAKNKKNEELTLKKMDSIYRTYITAIKTKPFLLLAGISGTGKSRIVRELARSCWAADSEEYIAQKPKNFEMIQVKPNWHDSSELIGYVSRINGAPDYVVGDFLKFIAKAWENWLSDDKKPYFLCLDEMNLAPVEQYFAEYLSVVESRKVDGEENIVYDPIVKKDSEGFSSLVQKLSYENQALKDMFESKGICLPPNLIVVGTVNMDETTFSFSRKVLDRAMTIEMNNVDLYGGLTTRYEPIGLQSIETLIGTAVEGVDVYDSHKEVCDKCIKFLEKINSQLEGTPFKVAYRTRNEYLLYVVNNLPYTKDENGTERSQDYVIARALDEITNMKVLSRIEGDESKVSEDFLRKLKNTISEGLTDISSLKYADKAKISEEEGVDNIEKSISLAKLSEMTKKLDSGYTSFWS